MIMADHRQQKGNASHNLWPVWQEKVKCKAKETIYMYMYFAVGKYLHNSLSKNNKVFIFIASTTYMGRERVIYNV